MNGYRKQGITYNGVLFSLRKKETLPFVTTEMNLEDIKLREISHTVEQVHDTTYMRNLK